MKLEAPARQFCHGILLGLYRVRDSGGNDILNWAPDFPGEAAANVLEVWSERGAAEVAVIGDGDDISEIAQVHRSLLQ